MNSYFSLSLAISNILLIDHAQIHIGSSLFIIDDDDDPIAANLSTRQKIEN